MKALTHEDWMKNPTSRMMWVWDDYEVCKEKMKVLYVLEQNVVYPVIVLNNDGTYTSVYKHCAELPKQRRMTNKELSRWLRENPTRECKYHTRDDCCIHSYLIHSYLHYYESLADEEVDDTILIRENDGEWREPLVEEEE